MWIVHCAAAALRRAGIAFSKGANDLDASVLSDAQIAALEAEPKLAIDKNPTAKPADDLKPPAKPADDLKPPAKAQPNRMKAMGA